MSKQIDLLLGDKKLREEMGTTGRELYGQNFTKELHIDKLIGLMETIVKTY